MKNNKKDNRAQQGQLNDALMSIMTIAGQMTFGKDNDNLNLLDFKPDENGVVLTAFTGDCKVQIMRDGTVHIVEKKYKYKKNKKLFREDNSSLSLGRDGYYYFFFKFPQSRKMELPDELFLQASNIANKFDNKYIQKKGRSRK